MDIQGGSNMTGTVYTQISPGHIWTALYIYVSYGSPEKRTVISMYKMNSLVFIHETYCVYSLVRPKSLNIIQANLSLYIVNVCSLILTTSLYYFPKQRQQVRLRYGDAVRKRQNYYVNIYVNLEFQTFKGSQKLWPDENQQNPSVKTHFNEWAPLCPWVNLRSNLP